MRSCLRRLLSVSIVLVFVAVFYSIGVCERAYAAKPDDGTTSGSGMDTWNDGGSSTTSTGNVGSGKPWKSFGNDDIDETQHFLGTTDDNDIVIKTNNTEKARITSEGNVGIGTDAPTGTLHVEGGSAVGADDGTDITINAQDGGPDGGAGGNIVLKPGTGSGFVTDDDGNPVQATGEDGSPLFEEDENGNLIPVFIPNSGNVIIDGNLAPSSGHTITLGTPELRYSGIYLASWFKYDTDGLYFYYTADERTPVDYFHARFTVDATPYIGDDGWTYFDVDAERSGNLIISPDALFESPLGTEKLQVDGDVMSTGNVEAVSFTGDGSLLTGSTQAVTDEALARTNADNALQAGLDQEVADRNAAILVETNNRIADVNAEEAARLAAPASGITNAGSGLVITDSERTTLGTALQSETDPTVDLDKLKVLVGDDYHALGGVDADTDTQLSEAEVDAFVANNGFSTGAHTVDTTLDKAGVEALNIDITESQISDLNHTVDTNTQLSEAEVDAFVANNGFSTGAHTVDTKLDKAGVEALNIDITESQISDLNHTVDTNTQLSEAEVDAFVANNGFSTGAHTVDTKLDKAGVEALNIDITESQISDLNHTTDTNTQLSEAEVDAFVANNGFSTGAHTVDTDTQRTDAEIIAAVDTAGYVSGTHTSDGDISALGYIKTETDPEVGVNTLNKIPKWDGSALVTGSIFDNGNVGIGDTNPTNALKIVDSANQFTTLQIAAKASGTDHLDGLWIQVNSKANPDVSILNRENGTLRFGTNATDKLVIEADGDVGIGTTSPTEKLTVAGTIESTSGGVKFPDGTTQTTAATASSGPTSFFEVFLSGNQSIGYYFQKINWGVEDTDTNNEFDLSTDRFTVKIAGMYMIQGAATITCSQTRFSAVQLRKNDTTIAEHISSPSHNGAASTNCFSIMVNANVGDYFEVWGHQISGDSNRYALGGKQYTYFKAYRLP